MGMVATVLITNMLRRTLTLIKFIKFDGVRFWLCFRELDVKAYTRYQAAKIVSKQIGELTGSSNMTLMKITLKLRRWTWLMFAIKARSKK